MEDYLSLFHWTFFAVALIVSTVTEFTKRIFKLMPQTKLVVLFTPQRLFPAFLGILIGLIPGIPAPEFVGGEAPGIGHALYFGTAGIVSAWVYSLGKKSFEEAQGWISQKFGNNSSKIEEDEDEGIDDDTTG